MNEFIMIVAILLACQVGISTRAWIKKHRKQKVYRDRIVLRRIKRRNFDGY